jgi:hypothetical protein
MAKLTKLQRKNHEAALKILEKDVLNDNEKEFVFTHYHEGATNNNGDAGAFFTPLEMAYIAAHDCIGDGAQSNKRVIDMCAGIGALSYALVSRYCGIKVVCVEINPEYVAVGKKLVPEAEWHCADVLDKDFILSLGNFNSAISNPPFGKVRSMKDKHGFYYSGAEGEYKVMDMASIVADNFCFIVPQQSAGFRYSGARYFDFVESNKCNRFQQQTNIDLVAGMGYDTTAIEGGEFKDVEMIVEFVHGDTQHIEAPSVEVLPAINKKAFIPVNTKEQYTLFDMAL